MFPSHKNPASTLGGTDFQSDTFHLGIFADSMFPDAQIPGFPDAAAPPLGLPDELADPNFTPLPTYPGIRYIARSQMPLPRQMPLTPSSNGLPASRVRVSAGADTSGVSENMGTHKMNNLLGHFFDAWVFFDFVWSFLDFWVILRLAQP